MPATVRRPCAGRIGRMTYAPLIRVYVFLVAAIRGAGDDKCVSFVAVDAGYRPQQVVSMGEVDGGAAGGDSQLGEQVRNVHTRRLLADEQRLGDLLVRPAAGEQLEHLELPGGDAEVIVGARRLGLDGAGANGDPGPAGGLPDRRGQRSGAEFAGRRVRSGEQIDGLVAAAAGEQHGFGLPPTAIGGGERETGAVPCSDGARPGVGVAGAREARPFGDGRRRRRAQFGGRAEQAPIGKLAEPAQQIEPAVDRVVPSVGRTQADERQPGNQLLVGRSLNPLVDDSGNHVKVAAAPRALGKAGEQQPVEPSVAQAERVRPHDLEAVAGPLDIAAGRVEQGCHGELYDPVDPLMIERREQRFGLIPTAELVAVGGGDGLEDPGEHRHRPGPGGLGVGDRGGDELGGGALGDDELPEVTVDAGGVGQVATAHGKVEGTPQLGEPAVEITGRRQRHPERVPRVPLVSRRSHLDGHGDRLGRSLGGMLGTVDPLEGVGASGEHAGAGGRRRIGRNETDCVLVGIQGIVGAALLQQTPAAPFVEDRGPSWFSLRIEPVERIGNQLGSTVEVAGAAGDIGGAIDDLGARNREVGRGEVVIVEHREQPVVIALGLG